MIGPLLVRSFNPVVLYEFLRYVILCPRSTLHVTLRAVR
jgi:hypothetical protein